MVGNCVVALSTVPTTVLLTTFIWSRFSCLKSDMDFDFFIALIVIMGEIKRCTAKGPFAAL